MCRKNTATHARLCTMWMMGWALAACGSEKQAPVTAPPAPSVALLELPIALRSQAARPADAVQVDVTTAGLGVAGQHVLDLAGGNVDTTERQGDELPKLVQALKAAPQHAHVALAVSAMVPYQTVASVIASAKAAGASSIVFHVRSPSASAVGYLALDDFELRAPSKNDEAVPVPGVAVRPWSDFVAQWEAVQNACRAARTGSCASKPESVADGGDLKLVLHAAGQGVNVDFFRIGPPPAVVPPPQAAKDKGKGSKHAKANKKSRKKHGEPEAPAEDAEPVIPATEALFQFRAQEAVTVPSPVSETIKPVCGSSACGVVVQAEKATPFLRVVSLLGAAFPDATPAPHVVFERP